MPDAPPRRLRPASEEARTPETLCGDVTTEPVERSHRSEPAVESYRRERRQGNEPNQTSMGRSRAARSMGHDRQQNGDKIMENTDIKSIVDEALKESAPEIVRSIVDPLIKESFSAKREEEEREQKALNDKFKTFGEFLSSIVGIRRDGRMDNRLTFVDSKGRFSKPAVDARGKATLVEGIDSAGGFLVPEQYNASLIQEGLESAIVRPNGAFAVPMVSDTLRYPRINSTSNASTVYGGVVAYWQGEGGTYQESEPTFGDITLTAKKLMGYTKVSEELLADAAISLDPFIRRLFAESWAHFEDIAFLRGTGSGQPLGVLNAPALISVTRQDTDDLIFEDILNVLARTSVDARKRGVFLTNHENLPKLLRMHSGNTVTNAYGAPLVFINNIRDAINYTIFGRPLIVCEKMSAAGTVGDFGFFDFSRYMIGDRQGLTIDISNQVYWTTGYVAFKFTERVDGQPMVASAMTPYKGTATLSPFVTLGETS